MNDEELDFIVDGMTWSFSRLNSFYDGCQYEWYLRYVQCNKAEGSFFADFGSFMHKILELYAKGELTIFDITQYYIDHFEEEVTHDAPPNRYVDMKQSYYEKGLDYLNNINLDFDRYEILGVEKPVDFYISNKKFVGYIDLLLRDRETGKITIADHKSASIKVLKSGKIAKGDRAHFESFKRQLYLYSIPILQEYGEDSVDALQWNMFRLQKFITIPWVKAEYLDTIKWAEQTLVDVDNEESWFPKQDLFYCNYLCGQRERCPYRAEFPPKEEEDAEFIPE